MRALHHITGKATNCAENGHLDWDSLLSAVPVLSLWSLIVWLSQIGFAAHPSSYDFSQNFYVGARLLVEGHRHSLYDLELQRSLQLRYFSQTGVVFCYPAPVALLYAPVTVFGPVAAHFWWAILTCLLIASSCHVFFKALDLRNSSLWAFLTSALFVPVYFDLVQGQVDAVLLFVFSAAFASLKANRHFRAGVLLAIALVKFQLVLPFVFVLMLRKMWSLLSGFFIGSAGFVATWLAISGPASFSSYLRLLLDLNSIPGATVNPAMMANLRGALFIVTSTDVRPAVLAALGIPMLAWAAKQWRHLESGFAVTLVVTLLVSYHSYPHSLILLLLPLGISWKRITVEGWRSINAVSFFLASLPLIPIAAVLAGSFAYMAIPTAILGWSLSRPLKQSLPPRDEFALSHTQV